MNSRWVWVAVGGLIVFMVVAVVGFGTDEPGTGDGGGAGTGFPIQDPDLVAMGEPLYQASCATCHGDNLRGTAVGPSHLSIVYEPNHHGDAAFYFAARDGVKQHHWPFGDMAPVPGLSDKDLEAIVAYVRENQRIFGFEPYPP